MPQHDEVRFVLSSETDVEFRNALARLAASFPGWTIEGLVRETVSQGGATVPVGVIKIKI